MGGVEKLAGQESLHEPVLELTGDTLLEEVGGGLQ